MIASRRPLALGLALLLLAGCASTVDRFVDRAADAAGRAIDRQVDHRTDRAVSSAIDGMFDAGENAVRCVFTDDACIERAQRDGDPVVLTDADGTPVDRSGTPVSAANAEDAVVRTTVTGADANYDFQPGERTLFADDFSDDRVGDFPRSLHYLSGTAEVVSFEGRRFLHYTASGAFEVRLDQTLPTTFTIEMDVQGTNDGSVSLYTRPRVYHNDTFPFYGYDGDYLNVGSWRGSGLWSGGDPKSTEVIPNDRVVHVEITVDDAYVKMYADGNRIANVPRVDLGRHDAITFVVNAREDLPVYLTDLRIASGGNDLYSALESEGRIVLDGVRFETGSATLTADSESVLSEVATLLRQQPGLRLRIEGHTDNAGSTEANRALSERRAQAVRDHLVFVAGVDGARLEATGFGEDRPVASNDTPSGRQQNRRVELVRL